MARSSIVVFAPLLLWPLALAACVLYLTVEAAALAVSSPAFVPLVVSMAACVLGCLDAALVMWRHSRDQREEPLAAKALARTFALFAISLAALCAGAWQVGVPLLGLSR